MDVTGPTEVLAGSTIYFTATGFSASANVEADVTLDGDALPAVITAKPAGGYQICVALPSGKKGGLDIDVGDGQKGATTSAFVL